MALAATPDAPDAGQRAALDSVAALLAADPGRRLVVRYTDPTFARASASWRLAVRVAEYLAAGDVAAGRVALARVPEVRRPGLPPGAEAVEVRVEAP